jgi:hypothetical protein
MYLQRLFCQRLKDFVLMANKMSPFLLSLWCTLNTSYGGTLLGLVGFSGLVTVGGKLLVGLPKPTTEIASEAYKQNRKRRRSILIGFLTLIFLLGTVASFFVTADRLRALESTCDVSRVSGTDLKSLYLFFGFAVLSALFSVWFYVRTTKSG